MDSAVVFPDILFPTTLGYWGLEIEEGCLKLSFDSAEGLSFLGFPNNDPILNLVFKII